MVLFKKLNIVAPVISIAATAVTALPLLLQVVIAMCCNSKVVHLSQSHDPEMPAKQQQTHQLLLGSILANSFFSASSPRCFTKRACRTTFLVCEVQKEPFDRHGMAQENRGHNFQVGQFCQILPSNMAHSVTLSHRKLSEDQLAELEDFPDNLTHRRRGSGALEGTH